MSAPYSLKEAKALGGGHLSPGGSLSDRNMAAFVSRYKRAVASRHRAVLGEEIETVFTDQEMCVSKKIDGEQWCMVVAEGGDVYLANPVGRVISGDVGLLKEAKESLKNCQAGTVLAGELHVEIDGRARHNDLASALAANEDENLRFSAFDLARDGDTEVTIPYQDRLKILQGWLGSGKTVDVVETEIVDTVAKVRTAFDKWTAAGAEGAVVRSGPGLSHKIKPAVTLEAVVCGYTVRDDPTQVSSLLLGTLREDGTVLLLCHCGNIGDEPARRTLKEKLLEIHAESNYSEANTRGAMFQFIRPELIAEIRVTDIQPTGRNGEVTQKMVLSHEGGSWKALRRVPGASAIHPRLIRFREDKQFRQEDVSLTQLSERVHIPEAQTAIDSTELPKSELLRRQVFTKVTKGKTAVRKLVLWKTNKDEKDSTYSSFVVHFTDYSPGRKEPLKRTVRLAQSEERANVLAEEWLKSEIKRGWNEVGA